MKLRLRIALATAVATIWASTGSVPAVAGSTQVCVGGGAVVTAPLYYTGIAPAALPYSLSAPPGTSFCGTTATGGLAASGSLLPLATVAGANVGPWCQAFTMRGSVNGHSFTAVQAGVMAIFTGPEVYGVIAMVPDVTTTPPQSCLNGATRFLFAGVFVFV